MSPAGPEHRKVSRPFRRELSAYWASHRELVEDVDVEAWIATSSDDDRIADICVYLCGTSQGKSIPHRVPNLVFEFVSADRADQERDYIAKREEYHRIGVREYVIVDRLKRSVLVLTWDQNDFDERILGPDSVYETPLLPGLKINVNEALSG